MEPVISTGVIVLLGSAVALLILVDWYLSGKLNLSRNVDNIVVWSLNLLVAAHAVELVTPLYHWAYLQRLSPLDAESIWLTALAVLVYDFLYYWFHRGSHKLSLLWKVHSVHHQTTKLIPSLGLRSSAFDFAVIWMITIPMILLGFGSQYLIAALFVHGLYQLFLHNEWNLSLGKLEWLFNTPRHHSLHHATNPEYIDKNFGSIFIIWDRLFGTFVKCKKEPEIGIHGPNYSHDPLLTNLAPFAAPVLPSGWQRARGRFSAALYGVIFVATMLAIWQEQLANPLLLMVVLLALFINSIVVIGRHEDRQ